MTAMTSRQMEVARLIRDDLSNKEIAAQLGISDQTVKNHITLMLRSLRVASRVGIALWVDRLEREQERVAWTDYAPS